MKFLYYVVLRRLMKEEDVISIHSFDEAVSCNWIDGNGERVWVVPPQNEFTTTFVWGFNSLDLAIDFYDVLQKNEVGMPCKEID